MSACLIGLGVRFIADTNVPLQR